MEWYRLTGHAKKRIAERGISINDIESALKHPDIVQPSFNKRKILVKFIRNKRLEVVTAEKRSQIIIITIYYAN